MNILYCGDKNISGGILLSVLSLLENTKEKLNIFILTASIDNHSPIGRDFESGLNITLKKYNPENQAKVIDITEMFADCKPEANLSTRFTPFCMLRLFADEVKEIPDKILYLDCDVLARKDFKELYKTDVSEFEICGVPDRYGKYFFGHAPFKHDYINSGVLLMNMDLVRGNDTFKKCRELCRTKKMFMPDQTALNKLAKKMLIKNIFNEQGNPKEDTVFQHFTTRFIFFPFIRTQTVKPWDINGVHEKLKLTDYDGLYDKFLKEKQDYEL